MTRTLGRTRASLGLLSAALLAPPWLLLPPRGAAAKHLERRFHRLIASGFGLRPRAYGNPGGAGTMFVANHISWADIVSLAAVVDADFVAKSDVAGYPGLGKLAARTGTIFIDRERRSQAGAQMAAIRERLVSGHRVALFPEGTTSDGRGVLPFRTSLFAAAGAARRVQPVTIVYTTRGGGPIRPETLDAIAWIGDEDLLRNAATLARVRAGITIHFLDPVDPAAFETRKALAEHCREAVLECYQRVGPV